VRGVHVTDDRTGDDTTTRERPATRPGVSFVARLVEPYSAVRGNTFLSRFLISEFVSSIGDWLYLVALLVVIAEVADPVVLGLVGAARVLPYVLLSGIGGLLADRFDRRAILISTDLARGVLMLALAAAIWFTAPVAAIVVLVVLAACGSSIAGPALAAYLPSLARDETELGPANAAWATLDNIAFIIGPAAAGILTTIGGASGAMLLNAVSFGVVAVVLSSLPTVASKIGDAAAAVTPTETSTPEPATAPTPSETTQTAVDEPNAVPLVNRIAAPLLVDLGASIVGGALGIATVVIATDQLHAGDSATGWLNAATGIGGVVGGVAVGRFVNAPPARLLAVGGIVGGLGLIALGITETLLVAIALMAVASAGLLVLDVANSTYVQRVVDDEARGRASGLFHMLGALAFAAGSLILPILASWFGIAPALGAIVLVGGAFVVAGILLLARPKPIDRASRRALRLLQESALGGLPVPQLARAAGAAVEQAVAAGEAVVSEGEVADAAYVIERGTFEVTIGGAARRRLGPGDVFGERGILLRAPRSATVRAVDDGALLRLDGPAFLALVTAEPRVSDQLLALYGGRR
jgi:MFS family permease